ncbi:MAG: hypothetical protein GEU90_21960 [Gemmatimonas sp.]|nr:hypothetical protein [Gemmatimonas sp.]
MQHIRSVLDQRRGDSTPAKALSLLLAAATVLVTSESVAGQSAGQYVAHPSTQSPERLVTLGVLADWAEEYNNWGRWGPDDQRGTLNLITPEKTRQATSLVREGRTVNLHHNPIKHTGSDTGGFGENVHRMARIDPETGQVGAALDIIQLSLHDGLHSHLDALCHYQKTVDGERVIFNGYPANLSAAGCQDLAIDKMGPGYVTRGVLVDMPLLKGVDWLEPSTPIYVEDLEEWERYAGITMGPGDALLIRSGRWAKRAAEGPWAYGQGGAGVHASVIPWLAERDVAVLISDAVNDVQPSGVEGINRPIHTHTQVELGLPIVDNAYLEDAAELADELDRWEFMFTLHIMQLRGATAAPFSALATF